MNPSPAIGNNKSSINIADDVLWVEGTTETMYYVHKDYLGSISAITDATGNLIESLSYDAWGRRRKATDWTDYNVPSTLFDRGFTGHEHLSQFGLINMNGRVYDPFLARFLSPDPFVQAPGYTQNYNRYSYAWNNPLKYTDPSGYYIDGNRDYTPAHIYLDSGGSSGSWLSGNQSNMTGGFGPGSGRHWSDAQRSSYGNFMLGNSTGFDRMYGQGSYNGVIDAMIKAKKEQKAASGKLSNGGLITDPASIAMITSWIQSGFNLSIISAFGRTTLVGSMGSLGSYRFSIGGLVFSNLTAGMVAGEAIASSVYGSNSWVSNVDWTGVANSSLSIIAGFSEMVVGGLVTYKTLGSSSARSVPLMLDGSYRVTANTIRLIGYLTGKTRFSNAMPGNIGASFGKLIDMSFGASFYDYGYGQALGGGTNDFVASVVTGGTAGPLNSFIKNYNTTNAVLYLNAYAGYNTSMFFNFYPLIK